MRIIIACKKMKASLLLLALLMMSSRSVIATAKSYQGIEAYGHDIKLLLIEMPAELQAGFNQQINSELEGAYVYFDIANYFSQRSLDGFGKWFTAQFYEEVNHSRILSNFLSARNVEVKLIALPAPALSKGSPLEIFQQSLAIEEAQTKKIHALYALAESLNQYEATSFLKFFLDEQVQEENMFRNIVDRLTLLAGDATGILALDRELALRLIPAPFVPVAN